MDEPAVRVETFDIFTVVGSSLFQPLADLTDKLLAKEDRVPGPSGPSSAENGYAVAIIVLLNVVLESYLARVKVKRQAEVQHGKAVPEQLSILFADLPNADAVRDVYMVGKIASHNHIWNLELSDAQAEAVTLKTPKELGFASKKEYEVIVDTASRKTRLLQLNAIPTALDRHDVKVVLDVVWTTLKFMAAKNYEHTPVHAHSIRFRGKSMSFGDLLPLFPLARSLAAQ